MKVIYDTGFALLGLLGDKAMPDRGIHLHCCYFDWNWWVLKMQETVTVPFGVLGGEEIHLRNWQIIRREKKIRQKISARKSMFVC